MRRQASFLTNPKETLFSASSKYRIAEIKQSNGKQNLSLYQGYAASRIISQLIAYSRKFPAIMQRQK